MEGKKLRKNLALCRRTVEKLTLEKQILMDELFIVDPDNSVLRKMREDQ